MAAKQPSLDLPTLSFPSVRDFEAYLEREHLTAPGLHLKLAKKSSGIPSVSASDAVETALCFGWIDGQANGIDENWWSVRYIPRRSKSIWSQKNVNTVEKLIKDGRMRPAGLAAVNAAKNDGRWDRAYAGPASINVPDDFKSALDLMPTAKAFFEGLNRSDRYSVLWRVETASPKARAGRIEAVVQMLATGQVPGAAAKLKAVQKKRTANSKRVNSQATRITSSLTSLKQSAKADSDLPRRSSPRAHRHGSPR